MLAEELQCFVFEFLRVERRVGYAGGVADQVLFILGVAVGVTLEGVIDSALGEGGGERGAGGGGVGGAGRAWKLIRAEGINDAYNWTESLT